MASDIFTLKYDSLGTFTVKYKKIFCKLKYYLELNDLL